MTQAQTTVDPDALYQSYDKNLYRITGSEEEDSIMQMMQADPGANNSANVQTSASDIGSGVGTATMIQATGSIQQGKQKYDNTAKGFILGTDPATGNAKFFIGDTVSYLNWNGDTGTLTIKGSISASSIDIPDTSTTASFHVDSSGNAWWGATTLAASTASVTSAGVATFAGLTSINMKAFTDFETAARFITSVAGTGAASFGNQGVTISPGATGTSYCRTIWWITNSIFNNNPTFSCSFLALNSAGSWESGDGVGFIGLGLPTISGSGFTETGKNYCGFEIKKDSGVTTIIAVQCDGGGTVAFSSTLLTVHNGDSVELFLKMTPTGINYYTRQNGGALSAATTMTTHMPTGQENYIMFAMSNKGTTTDFQLQLQCAAYEH